MKTTITLIAFLTIAQSPAQQYGRHDYYNDTHRQDVDRIIEAQAATTRAVEAARVQAEDDAQRARQRAGTAELEAKLEAAHQQRVARADAMLESTYVPRYAPAASSYTPTGAPPLGSQFPVTPEGDIPQYRPLDEDLILMAAHIIRLIHAAPNLTAAQKQREVQHVVTTVRKAAALNTPK